MSDDPKEPLVLRVVERLAASYPETPRAHIEGIVADEFHTLNRARIRGYIPILVERSAWNRLHRERTHHTPDR
ncbi:three-helix bundle dimerization domain-containing protein [Pseudarthrobacter sp. NPDC058329]|uniref:three-helix bundle dimerization domain-containing protein n=1 Tax=Pseudarthrobacter sp. NPDC058329 TaxID=3346448 RepID=UPI0036DC37C8